MIEWLTTGWRQWVFYPFLVLGLLVLVNRLGCDGTHVADWLR